MTTIVFHQSYATQWYSLLKLISYFAIVFSFLLMFTNLIVRWLFELFLFIGWVIWNKNLFINCSKQEKKFLSDTNTALLTLRVPAHIYTRGKNYAQVTRLCIYTFWRKILVLWPWEWKQCAIFVAQVYFGN